MNFLKFNDLGVNEFERLIIDLKAGNSSTRPAELLADSSLTELVEVSSALEDRDFEDRVELGCYVAEAISGFEAALTLDIGFWTALSALWFDQLSPAGGESRKVRAVAQYVLDLPRRSYRHLVWGSWWVVQTFGEDGYYLLRPQTNSSSALTFGGSEPLAQLGANQMTASSLPVMRLGGLLYSDLNERRQRKGASAGEKQAGPRRLIQVLRQLELNYDFTSMAEEEIAALLPDEFRSRLEEGRKQRLSLAAE